jgi:predicted oxidoreductase
LLSPVVAGLWRLLEWRLDAPALARWIDEALDLGITAFDHADVYGGYGAEAAFGDALATAPALRERLTLVTKCGIKLVSPARPEHRIKSYDTSRAHVLGSVDHSLRALRTDRIDLLLIHRLDALTDPDELADTFLTLRRAGKVLHFGLSNHTPATFAMLHRRIALATHQFELSPLRMGALTDGTLDQATDLGLPPMIWSPLAGGRLVSAEDEASRRVREVLEHLGRKHGVSAATMAYAWIRRHPARPIPITGSGRIEALREAVASLAITMPAEDWHRVWQASAGREVA